MKCVICKQGTTQPGKTTVTFHRDESVIVFRGVPAQICEVCGEYYLDDSISADLLRQAEESIARGVEIDVRHFVAA